MKIWEIFKKNTQEDWVSEGNHDNEFVNDFIKHKKNNMNTEKNIYLGG